MQPSHRRLLALAPLLLACGLARAADDWPEWRGPQRDGISRESGWAPNGARENLWERAVGLGYSAVSVADGRLFTLGHDVEAGLDALWCLQPETGAVLWRHQWPAERWNRMHVGGTNSTPTVDGERVYVLNREGRLMCLSVEDGDVVWERQLAEELELELPSWGFAGSPLVVDDVLYVNVGPLLALSKEDGEERWRSTDFGHAYSTPVHFEADGDELLAVFNGGGLAVVEAADGALRGQQPFETRYDVNAATPIAVDGKLFISAGYNHGCALVAITADGLELEWENRVMKNQLATSVLLDGVLYGFDESLLKAVDLEGNELWRQRGLGKGALCAADGRLVLVSSRGELVVANADPAAYEELSRVDLLDEGACWTPPTLANGLIYVRNASGQLICRDHRAGGQR